MRFARSRYQLVFTKRQTLPLSAMFSECLVRMPKLVPRDNAYGGSIVVVNEFIGA